MKRISDEDGRNAGTRNIGRFFLFSIPLTLGLAAAVWFGLWVAGYDFQKEKAADKHELSQEERSAVFVGAGVKPKGKLAVEMVQKTCFTITRADFDTKKKGHPYDDSDYVYSLILYGQNNCNHDLSYASWHWEMISPNGVILNTGYSNQCPIPPSGEVAECPFRIDHDERADKFRVWGQNYP
jgi:hypothetical protein